MNPINPLLALSCLGLMAAATSHAQEPVLNNQPNHGEILELEELGDLDAIEDIDTLADLEDYDHVRDLNRQIDQAIIGDTAVLLEAGELEITLGTSFESDGKDKSLELTVQVEYGLTDSLEVGFEAPYLFVNPDEDGNVDGIGDVTLTASIALLSAHPYLVSLSLDATIPTGNEHKNDELGDGTDTWEPSIAIDVELANEAELVFDFSGEFGNDISAFSYEATYAHPFRQLVPSIGIEGTFDGADQEISLVPGMGFPIADDVEIGIEVPIGLNRETTDWTIDIELTFEFE